MSVSSKALQVQVLDGWISSRRTLVLHCSQMTSSKPLAWKVDELKQQCPSLLPNMNPQGYQDEDLLRLVASEGTEEHDQLQQLLSAAASSCRSCCICASPGQPSNAPACEQEEACTLRFTTFSHLSFVEKTISISRGGFACGQCRAMGDTWRFLRFSALKLGAERPEREELVRRLCSHFAAVNKVSDEVLASSDSVVTWVQEVFSRAYGLQVVASNLNGWKVAGPDGSAVRQGCPGTAVRLAKLLLATGQKQSLKRKERQQPNGSGAKTTPGQVPVQKKKKEVASSPDVAEQPMSKKKLNPKGFSTPTAHQKPVDGVVLQKKLVRSAGAKLQTKSKTSGNAKKQL